MPHERRLMHVLVDRCAASSARGERYFIDLSIRPARVKQALARVHNEAVQRTGKAESFEALICCERPQPDGAVERGARD
jgi:hypothetical protein